MTEKKYLSKLVLIWITTDLALGGVSKSNMVTEQKNVLNLLTNLSVNISIQILFI